MALVCLVAAAVLVLVVARSASSGRVIRMEVPQATGMRSGFDVRMGGVQVGKIDTVDITPAYRARLTVRLDDERAWPLPVDTRFRGRLGGTIKYSDRYIEIERGRSRRTIADGATLPASSYVDPVEFDTVFNTFDRRTRGDMAATFAAGAGVAPRLANALPRALEPARGPAAAVSVRALMRELGDDPEALDTLVRSTAGVANAAARANPGVGEMVTSAATTFGAVASRTHALEEVLEQAPSTLASVQGSSGRLTSTLASLREVTRRLAPGVDQLRSIAPSLSHLLVTVRRVGPDARATLARLGTAAPHLSALLDRGRDPLMPLVESIGREGAKQLNCIRPYSPEIAGFASTWAGWFSRGDQMDKFVHAQAGSPPFHNDNTDTSADVASRFPRGTVRMALPRPPGHSVAQDWFLPECGITPAALDPTQDPEANAFDPLSKDIVSFTEGDPGRRP